MSNKKILHVTYDMSIFCIEQPIGPWGKEVEEHGISIYIQNRKEGFDISLIGAIRKILKKEKIDVIHCRQYTPWVYGVISAIGLHTKVRFTEYGRFYPESSSWKRRIVNLILSAFTESITAIS
jgi:hypothetical protein